MNPAAIRHLAINADDVAETVRFYESAFAWRFEPYFQDGFMRAEVGGLLVACQRRRPIAGVDVTGFEATVAVPDLAGASAAARAAGGRVLTGPTSIPGVGDLAFLEDPAGNVVGAMRYHAP